jgi:hypothetical protein
LKHDDPRLARGEQQVHGLDLDQGNEVTEKAMMTSTDQTSLKTSSNGV